MFSDNGYHVLVQSTDETWFVSGNTLIRDGKKYVEHPSEDNGSRFFYLKENNIFAVRIRVRVANDDRWAFEGDIRWNISPFEPEDWNLIQHYQAYERIHCSFCGKLRTASNLRHNECTSCDSLYNQKGEGYNHDMKRLSPKYDEKTGAVLK